MIKSLKIHQIVTTTTEIGYSHINEFLISQYWTVNVSCPTELEISNELLGESNLLTIKRYIVSMQVEIKSFLDSLRIKLFIKCLRKITNWSFWPVSFW